jgi:hypothetical protein
MSERDLWESLPKDAYALLGVTSNVSEEKLRAVWKNVAKNNHPDRGGDGETFSLLNNAYSCIRTPANRGRYDTYLEAKAVRQRAPRPGGPAGRWSPAGPPADRSSRSPENEQHKRSRTGRATPSPIRRMASIPTSAVVGMLFCLTALTWSWSMGFFTDTFAGYLSDPFVATGPTASLSYLLTSFGWLTYMYITPAQKRLPERILLPGACAVFMVMAMAQTRSITSPAVTVAAVAATFCLAGLASAGYTYTFRRRSGRA